MADKPPVPYRTLGLPVFDLKGRRIGRVKDAAIVPLVDPSRIDRYLVGGGDAWLTVRYDQVRSIFARRASSSRRRSSLRTTPTSTCCASRATCWTSRSSTCKGRKVVRVNDVTFEIRHNGRRATSVGCWKWTSASAAFSAACCRASCRRAGSGGCRARIPPQFHPLGILQHRGARSAAPPAPEHFQPSCWRTCTRPTWPISSRNLGPADREAIFENIDSEVAADALIRDGSQHPGQHSRIAGNGKGRRYRRGNGARRSRRCAGRTGRGDQRTKFWRRWSTSPRPKCRNCWNSRRTPPAA